MDNRQQNQRQQNNGGKQRGPESRFYKSLTGSSIRIKDSDGLELTAILVWVDRFTLGLRGPDGCEFLMNKGILHREKKTVSLK